MFVSHKCFRRARIESRSKCQRDRVKRNIARELQNHKNESHKQTVYRQERAQAGNIMEEHDNDTIQEPVISYPGEAFLGNNSQDHLQRTTECWVPQTPGHQWGNNHRGSQYTEPDFASLFNAGPIGIFSMDPSVAWDRFAVGTAQHPTSLGGGDGPEFF
jgi:hypothetical protein